LQWEEALALLARMQLRGPQPDDYNYGAAICACGECMQWQVAVHLLHSMQQRQVLPTVANRNAAMNACVSAGEAFGKSWSVQDATSKAQTALRIMNKMRRAGQMPTEITFNIAIRAFRLLGDWVRTLLLLREMRKQGMQPGAVSYFWTMDTLQRHGQDQHCNQLLRFMEKSGVDVRTFEERNAMISAVALVGDWRRALSQLDEFSRHSMRPDGFSYSTAILACRAEGAWEMGLALLWRMHDENVERPELGYQMVAHLFRETDRWELGMVILSTMRKRGLEPTGVTVSLEMRACSAAGKWELVLELAAEMDGRLEVLQPASTGMPTPALMQVQSGGLEGLIYGHALLAATKCSRWELSVHYLERIRNTPSGARDFGFSQTLGVLVDLGHCRRALQLYREGVTEGIFTPFSPKRAWLLELHNMTMVVAHLAVVDGIADAYRRGVKRLGIITGKGLHSPPTEDVTKLIRTRIGRFIPDALHMPIEEDISGGMFWTYPAAVRSPRRTRKGHGSWSWHANGAHKAYVGEESEDAEDWREELEALVDRLEETNEPPLGPEDLPRRRAARARRTGASRSGGSPSPRPGESWAELFS